MDERDYLPRSIVIGGVTYTEGDPRNRPERSNMHTVEKHDGEWYVQNEKGKTICSTGEDEHAESDARRAVACVNACADIPRPEGIWQAVGVLLYFAKGDLPESCDPCKAAREALRDLGVQP
jgi:hypothetical protein